MRNLLLIACALCVMAIIPWQAEPTAVAMPDHIQEKYINMGVQADAIYMDKQLSEAYDEEISQLSIPELALYDKEQLKQRVLKKTDIIELIKIACTQEGVDPRLVIAMVKTESYFRPRAISHKGAVGLMQVLPTTAHWLDSSLDVHNPFDNLLLGCRYIKMQLDKFKSVSLALAAYNAGPAKVIKYGYRVPPYKETRNYVKTIKQRMA